MVYRYEDPKDLSRSLDEERVVRGDLKRLYNHFKEYRKPEAQTDKQYKLALSNLFSHWVVKNGESALGAEDLIDRGIEALGHEDVDLRIVGRLREAYNVMAPKWLKYFSEGNLDEIPSE